MDLFTKTLIPLTVCLIACVQCSVTANLTAYPEGRRNRCADKDTLWLVVFQLSAKLTAAEGKINAMQADLDLLKTKHCETGTEFLQPHNKPERIEHDYRERRHTSHVTFSRPFSIKPWVAISLTGLDANKDVNIRVASGVSSVTTAGFDAYVYEWSNTHLYLVRVTWIACSP